MSHPVMSAIKDDLQLKTTTYSSSAIEDRGGGGWGGAVNPSLFPAAPTPTRPSATFMPRLSSTSY